ncbi:MAG: phosphatidate cytidylyltransferase [Bacillota bacterium]|nr:phosphatidate cytidylyltransferase [Bacillota bacterium]MDI7248823.1 phosphatidate cytidylyltransferase [Bacillota bacterium]
MLRTRILTVVLGAPPFLAALWWGGAVWAGLVALLAGAAAVEAVGFGNGGRSLPGAVLAALLAAGLVLFLGGMVSIPLPAVSPVPGVAAVAPAVAGPALLGVTLVVLVTMALDAALYPGGTRAPLLLLAVLYPGLGLGHLVLLRQASGGFAWSLFLLGTVWAADIAAYFAGMARGRHRLAPRLSPGKSWEGAAAGVVTAALVGLLGAPALLGLGALTGGLLGAGMAVAGMVGDLAESALKRAAGRKDSGRLVPGHGGVLDRFDSVAFAAPVLYWCRILGGM